MAAVCIKLSAPLPVQPADESDFKLGAQLLYRMP